MISTTARPAVESAYLDERARDAMPEQRLWGAALALLVEDACRAWTGRHSQVAHGLWPRRELQIAWRDLIECGPCTLHLCAMTDVDAVWLSERFRHWCHATPAADTSWHLRLHFECAYG